MRKGYPRKDKSEAVLMKDENGQRASWGDDWLDIGSPGKVIGWKYSR